MFRYKLDENSHRLLNGNRGGFGKKTVTATNMGEENELTKSKYGRRLLFICCEIF